MKKRLACLPLFLLCAASLFAQQDFMQEPLTVRNKRMQWWREARFGMFIHWGLYAIPAGEWKGVTSYGEWIRSSARIPLEEYDRFLPRFNPVHFNAEAWVRMAKDAGMKYITITSKHHDGFCLWDSKYTDFDVMSTPFQRDILKELADACKKIGGIQLCFYHSIMDWHHPDYNERRDWEKDRPVEGTDRNRYIAYMKNQLKELLTNYGEIGVLWFDGEWEGFWTHEDGKDLYNYVRGLQPGIIINNRVDKGRSGMAGMTGEGDYAGDFGTPEQEIPETGLPGVDWESCMTMNENWGYNRADKKFKSSTDLLRKLSDIASKGGNFLLNIGPMADGNFPPESVDRLQLISRWMKENSESIYGTQASPFDHTSWGRITQKTIGKYTKLYLHVFERPASGILKLGGIENKVVGAYWLAGKKPVSVQSTDHTISIRLPGTLPDPINSIIVVEIAGKPVVYKPPVISSYSSLFTDKREVSLEIPGEKGKMVIRYTLDGSPPHAGAALYTGKIILEKSVKLKAAGFVGNKKVSGIAEQYFEKRVPAPGVKPLKSDPGLQVQYYEGDWDKLPDFSTLKAIETYKVPLVQPGQRKGNERYGLLLQGFLVVKEAGVYQLYLSSDDGSKLYLANTLLIDNDGLHGMQEKKGTAVLAAGYHPLRIEFFEKTGGDDLQLKIESLQLKKQEVPAAMLAH